MDAESRWLYNALVVVTVSVIFLIIKQTRCTNFSDLFLEWNSTYFGQFLCPSSGVFLTVHAAMLYVTLKISQMGKND